MWVVKSPPATRHWPSSCIYSSGVLSRLRNVLQGRESDQVEARQRCMEVEVMTRLGFLKSFVAFAAFVGLALTPYQALAYRGGGGHGGGGGGSHGGGGGGFHGGGGSFHGGGGGFRSAGGGGFRSGGAGFRSSGGFRGGSMAGRYGMSSRSYG